MTLHWEYSGEKRTSEINLGERPRLMEKRRLRMNNEKQITEEQK